MKKSAFLLVTSDSPSCSLAIIALTLLEALHRELHTREPSARRDLILPAGPSPSSPWGFQGPHLPGGCMDLISLGVVGTCPP